MVSAWDTAGNRQDTTFTFVRDVTAPTSTVQCAAAACSASYYTTSPVSVLLTGDDSTTGGSGVQRIVYTTDGTTPAINASDTITTGTAINAASGSFNVSAEGTTTVKWLVEDNVGNISGVTTQTVKIDTVKPTISTQTITKSGNCDAKLFVNGSTIFYNSNGAACASAFTVTQTITDATSGPNTVNFPAIATGNFAHTNESPTTPWTSAQYGWTAAGSTYSGSQTLTATDVGTNSQTTSFTITNDNTAPATPTVAAPASGTNFRAATYSNAWSGTTSEATAGIQNASQIQVTLTNPSGQYWNGASWQAGATSNNATTWTSGTSTWTYTGPASLTTKGTYTISGAGPE